jgi:hypothetical protein
VQKKLFAGAKKKEEIITASRNLINLLEKRLGKLVDL